MFKRSFVAAAAAALVSAALVLAPGAGLANQDKDKEDDRDGKSRYELAPLSYLPLALVGGAQERIAKMYILMQQVSYLIEMTTGVKATSQNRVSLGGLFGGVFAQTYSAEDFVKSLEVGTVYRAGDGLLAVAMKGDRLLQDSRVIVFNGDYQYDPQALPSLQQISPDQMAKLQAYSVMVELANYNLSALALGTLATLNQANAANPAGETGLSAAQQTELPFLRERVVGKVYRGADNTLLVVIPPSIVLDR